MSRDVIAMLAMLAVVAAICLIVTVLIYLFAPPGWHRAPPLRTAQSSDLAIHCPAFASTDRVTSRTLCALYGCPRSLA